MSQADADASDADSDSATQPRHLNPLSPLVDALPAIPAVALATIFINGGALWTLGLLGVPVGLVLTVLVFLIYGLARYLVWRRFTFWFDGAGDLRIDSGVLYRNERKVQLSRLQAVDVEARPVARLMGLATVKIEVAGAGDARVALSFLTKPEALELRRQLLARAARDSHDAPTPPETILVRVATGDLFWSLMLRSATAALLVLSAVLVAVIFITEGALGVLLLPVSGGIPIFMVVAEFLALYGFTVARATDGVRLRHGLLKTEAQTVPHGRVAAVEIVEPLLWRFKGWVRIRLTVAGVAGSEGGDQSGLSKSLLLPVGTRATAARVLEQVLPGVDIEAIRLVSAPRKARWRAPIQWSQLAVGFDSNVFATRRGLITRRLSVVPHARTQSVSIVQGPYQRRLGLSTLKVDVAPGPVKIEGLYLPAKFVLDTATDQAARARVARIGDWSSGPHPQDPHPQDPQPPTG